MRSFTSALYLGMRHPGRTYCQWQRLTTGMPAALHSSHRERAVAGAIAGLQGCQSGVTARSTLHLFCDLAKWLTSHRVRLFVDNALYQLGQWAAEWVASQGIGVHYFQSCSCEALADAIHRRLQRQEKPVVLCDGINPRTGQVVPLAGYLDRIRCYGGFVVIDDTQALGVLGRQPSKRNPYGLGGGGCLRYTGCYGNDILLIASLAKAFGVPLAAIAGSRGVIESFCRYATTRQHCSPPAASDYFAAARALRLNLLHGDQLRSTLLRRIRQFRTGAVNLGYHVSGNYFPVQTLTSRETACMRIVCRNLKNAGMSFLETRYPGGDSVLPTFIITAAHTADDIQQLLESLAGIHTRKCKTKGPTYEAR